MTIEYGVGGVVGSNIPRLAPDLTYPSGRDASTARNAEISGIDASAALTTILSLSGKYLISFLEFSNLTAENNTVKLTIDGEVIWDDTYTVGSVDRLLGGAAVSDTENISCNESFLLEYQTATDTSIDFKYTVRPIL